jgi:hypothetical protein
MSLAANPFEPTKRSLRPVGGPKTRFNQFGLEYGRLLNDDYIHKKFLTVKYAGKGQSFIFNGKGTLDFKLGADKKEHPVTSAEVKFITNIEGTNLETKFDSKGVIRAWANFGNYNIGRLVNITAKVKTNNAFNYLSGYLGVEHQTRQFNVQARLDLKNGNIPHLNHKLTFNYDRFQLGAVAKLNLHAQNLARYNLFLGYIERDFSVFAEHVSRNKTKFSVGRLLAGAIYRRGGNDYVAKVSYRPEKQDQVRVKVGAVVNVNRDTVIRAKINDKTKLTLSSKFRYNSNLTLVAGTQVSLLDPSSIFTNKTVPIPLGLSVEFSYV